MGRGATAPHPSQHYCPSCATVMGPAAHLACVVLELLPAEPSGVSSI